MTSKKNDHEIVDLVDDDSTDDERNIDITNRRHTNGARGDDNDDEELECWTTNTTSTTKNPSSSNGTSSTSPKATMSNRKDPPANNTTTSKIRSNISSKYSVDDSDDDDNDVVIVDPPIQSSTTKNSRKSGIDASTTSASRKKNSVRGKNTPRHNSHSVLDDDNDDDAFWTKIKPSGLTKAKTSDTVDNNNNKKSNSNSFKSTPLAGTSRAGSISLLHGSSRSDNITTTSVAGKQRPPSSVVRNPYKRNITTKTPLRTSPPIRNPYEKNSTTRTPLRTSSVGNSHSSSASSSSPLSIGNSSSKTTKIVNPYASAGKKKISTNTTPPTAKSTATQKSDRSSSSSSSSIVPVAAATAAAASIRPSSFPVVDEGGICYPTLCEKTKMYADKRPNIILALWKYARSNLVRESYTMETLDRYATRIVDLAVTSHDFQIRSLGEYAFRKRTPAPKRGCGVSDLNHFNKLKENLESTKLMETRYEVGKCGDGKYFSIAEACLVAMKDMIFLRWNNRQKQQNQRTQFPSKANEQSTLFSQKEYCISLVDLIPEIDFRLRPECPARLGRPKHVDHGAELYLAKSTRSIEFKQIEKLLSLHEVLDGAGAVEEMAYMKKRKIDRRVHYQLTPLGFCKAGVISRRTFPNAIGHYRSSNLKSVLPKYKGICLAVDLREGGAGQAGSRKVLHEMCNRLDMKKIPYITTTLTIGDYCFFSGDLLCPILVERKSIQDVAQSIHDGRWESQKRRMYHGQFVFGYDNCRIAFIIEGKVEKQLVSNGFIGSAKFKVPKERFDEEIANLRSEGFDVIRTPHRDHSMFDLARWAEACAMDVQKGKLKLQFTYDEFVAEVGKIPKETDFSRLVKDHAQHKKHTETVDLLSDSNGDESGLDKKIQPIDLDEIFKKNRKRPPMSTSATGNNPSTSAQKRSKLDGDKKKEAIKQRNDLGEIFEKNRKRPPMPISATDNNPNTSDQKCFKLDGDKKKEAIKQRSNQENENVDAGADYSKWTIGSLKSACAEYRMKKSGTKLELIARLQDKSNRPPEVYCLRKQLGLYVPVRIDTSSTAILVAIQIKQDIAQAGTDYSGATKDELYALCEALEIKKDPWSGGTTQTGPFRKFFFIYLLS
jgi:hypothetical protein